MADSRTYEIQLVETLRSIGRALGVAGLSSSGSSSSASSSISSNELIVAINGIISRLETNKSYLDILLERLEYDQDKGCFHLKTGLISDSYIVAAASASFSPGGGGGDIAVYMPSSLEGTTFNPTSEADTFNAYTIQSLHTRIKALEQNPGGVSSVAGLTGDVAASDLFTALGLGTAATRAVGAIENANTGLVTGGDVYSFVNSSVATATATFRGTNTTATTEASFLAWADGLTHDLNDYVFWATTDAYGNTVYRRYKYNGSAWVFEYDLNNSSFTAAQWAAINSGITSQKITGYDTVAAYFTNGVLGTANIPQLPTSKITGLDTALTSLDNRTTELEKMFVKVSYTVGQETRYYLKLNPANYDGIAAEGFGVFASSANFTPGGGGGGADLGQVWQSLQNAASPVEVATNSKIAQAHLPSLSASGGLTASYGGTTLADSLSIGIDSNYKLPTMTEWNNKADASALAGYLPLSAGSGKALTGDLYMGSHAVSGATTVNAREIRIDGEPVGERNIAITNPWMTNGSQRVLWMGGKENSKYNSATCFFKYSGDQSANNTLGFGFFGNDYILNILADGRVGIGTTSPSSSYKVDIYGSLNATTIYQNGVALGSMAYASTGDYVSSVSINGDYLRVTKNGANTDLTIPYATVTKRLYRINASSSGLNLNTALSGGGIARNYSSTEYWINGPSLMGYGGVVELSQGETSLSMQFAWDINDNSTSSTNSLWWRAANNLGWQNDWKMIYHSGNSNLPTAPWTALSLKLNGTITGNTYTQFSHTLGSTNSGNGRIGCFDAPYSVTAQIGGYGQTETGDMCFRVLNNSWTVELFHISNNGNVGIYTTSPSYKLDVAGEIRSSSSNGTGWSNRIIVTNSNYGAAFLGAYLSSGGQLYPGVYSHNEALTAWNDVGIGGTSIYFYCGGYFNGRWTTTGLGIGIQNPSYALDVSGVINASTGVRSPGYGVFAASASSSDAKLKDGIVTISPERAWSVLMQLKPREWTWNANYYQAGKRGAGLVAQEVEPVLPFSVLKEDKYLHLTYDVMHGFEIAGLQDHETRLRKQETMLEQAEKRIAVLEEENKQLKARLNN